MSVQLITKAIEGQDDQEKRGFPPVGELRSRKVSEIDHQAAKAEYIPTGVGVALLIIGVILGAFFWGYGDLVLQNPTWILAGQVTFGVCLSLTVLALITIYRAHRRTDDYQELE